jgi:hypothetical protein
MKKMWKVKMGLLVIASVVVMAAVVMWLWNWLVPELFHGPVINFCQALGLMLLSRILFRGIHGMKGRGMYYGRWKNYKEEMEKMSPEQREKMRELWKKRCGGFRCDDESEEKDII